MRGSYKYICGKERKGLIRMIHQQVCTALNNTHWVPKIWPQASDAISVSFSRQSGHSKFSVNMIVWAPVWLRTIFPVSLTLSSGAYDELRDKWAGAWRGSDVGSSGNCAIDRSSNSSLRLNPKSKLSEKLSSSSALDSACICNNNIWCSASRKC